MSSRLRTLDFLRLILSILIMFTHARRLFHLEVPYWLTKGPFDGKAGVVLFFVLSGHVLSRSLARTPVSLTGYLQYFTRRAFRLFPAYWTALAFTFMILAWIKSDCMPSQTPGLPAFVLRDDQGWHQWLLHLCLVLPGMDSDFALPTVWSLMTEAKVSLLILPFLGWALLYLPRGLAMALVGVLSVCSGVLHEIVGTAAYLGIFGIGVMLTRATAKRSRSMSSTRWWTLLIAGISLYSCMSVRYVLPSVWLGYYLCAAGAAAIIVCITVECRLTRWMQKAQSAVGTDISYGIYLFHYPVMLGLLELVSRLGWDGVDHLLLSLSAMGISISLAWITAYGIEKPMNKLGRKLCPGVLVPLPGGNSSLQPQSPSQFVPEARHAAPPGQLSVNGVSHQPDNPSSFGFTRPDEHLKLDAA